MAASLSPQLTRPLQPGNGLSIAGAEAAEAAALLDDGYGSPARRRVRPRPRPLIHAGGGDFWGEGEVGHGTDFLGGAFGDGRGSACLFFATLPILLRVGLGRHLAWRWVRAAAYR